LRSLFVLRTPFAGGEVVPEHEDDKQAIQELPGRLAEAWNAGDAAAYASLFTEDADYVTFLGINMPGRRAIQEGHRALFTGPLRGSRLTFTDLPPTVRFVRPDVAIVVAGGSSSLPGGAPSDPGRESTLTFVMVREPAGWRITAFHNTRRRPAPDGRP
jgi:uncharacterized protein (TIGR02246 family)